MQSAVADTQKKGSVTIVIGFEPVAGATFRMVTVTDTVKTAKPARDREKTMFFRSMDGGLSRRDDRQPELPMRAVPAAERPEFDSRKESGLG